MSTYRSICYKKHPKSAKMAIYNDSVNFAENSHVKSDRWSRDHLVLDTKFRIYPPKLLLLNFTIVTYSHLNAFWASLPLGNWHMSVLTGDDVIMTDHVAHLVVIETVVRCVEINDIDGQLRENFAGKIIVWNVQVFQIKSCSRTDPFLIENFPVKIVIGQIQLSYSAKIHD